MTTLPIFDGSKLLYPIYRISLMNFSKNLDKENNPNLGLLGYLLSKMEFDEYSRYKDQTDSSLEFKLVNPPGNRPVVNQNPSQGDISLYKILISDWEYANRLYLQQQKAIDDLKSAIITSISISIQYTVGKTQSGFQFLSVSDILMQLDAFYFVATNSDLKEYSTSLDVPFILANDFEEFVITHRRVHDFFTRTGQAMSNIDKITKFIKAVNHSKSFDSTIDFFTMSNPTPTTYVFENLVITLRFNIARVRANVKLNPVPVTIASQAAISTGTTIPKKVFTKWTAEEKKAKKIHYCWTHGPLCTHKSSECKKQAPGHRVEATLDNPCNGRLVEWVSPQK